MVMETPPGTMELTMMEKWDDFKTREPTENERGFCKGKIGVNQEDFRSNKRDPKKDFTGQQSE